MWLSASCALIKTAAQRWRDELLFYRERRGGDRHRLDERRVVVLLKAALRVQLIAHEQALLPVRRHVRRVERLMLLVVPVAQRLHRATVGRHLQVRLVLLLRQVTLVLLGRDIMQRRRR